MLNFKLKPINELIQARYRFYVPAYQRGYKWTETEVLRLLQDIWDFKKYRASDESAFYCLQPVVVRPIEDKDGGTVYHVIDGQQRLTALLIIQQAIKNFQVQAIIPTADLQQTAICDSTYSIDYATRESSFKWLRDIFVDEKMQDNSDYFHFHETYEAAISFLKWIDLSYPDHEINGRKCPDKETDAFSTLKKVMSDRCYVIWYEPESGSTRRDEDIFDDLNTGKIPLTNAELIKAMFLQKNNFPDNDTPSAVLAEDFIRRLSREWDAFEWQLQDPAFWYFIYDAGKWGLRYENHIEYILDLIAGKTIKNSDDYYFTFNYFNDSYREYKERDKDNMTAFVKDRWYEVKELMLVLKDWYDNKEYYHYIGFLITQGYTVKDILKIQYPRNERQPSKKEFVGQIKQLIKTRFESYTAGDFYKGGKGLTPTLLLFNILIYQNCPDENSRFPFYRYKQMVWNEEHIVPVTPFEPTSPANSFLFSAQMLEYFTGISYYDRCDQLIERESEKPSQERKNRNAIRQEAVNSLKKQLSVTVDKIDDPKTKSICEDLLKVFVVMGKGEAKLSDKCYKKINLMFDSDNDDGDEESLNFIWNLALLDESTNKSYGNAIFPYKRMRIIKNDSKGIYVPIGTRNVFVKAYSHAMNNMFKWDRDDAILYLAEIFRMFRQCGFFFEKWLDSSKMPKAVDLIKLKNLISYEYTE